MMFVDDEPLLRGMKHHLYQSAMLFGGLVIYYGS